MQYEIKCQAYSLINVVNDEYLNTNETLRDENQRLKDQLNSLKQDLQKAKAEQLRVAKPYVDLTHDISDDSDIEIIEDKSKPKPQKRDEAAAAATAAPPAEIIELDGEVSYIESIMEANEKPLSPAGSHHPVKDEKSSAAIDESLTDLQNFENFLLAQI